MTSNKTSTKGKDRIEAYLRKNGIPYILDYAYGDLTGLNGNPLTFDFAIVNTKHKVLIGLIDHTEKYYEDFNMFASLMDIGNSHLDEDDNLKYLHCSKEGTQLKQVAHNHDDMLEDVLDNFIDHIDGTMYYSSIMNVRVLVNYPD